MIEQGFPLTHSDRYLEVKKVDNLEFMLENLPQNRPLYMDSGLWEIRSEDLETTYFTQGCNESFYQFIKRAFDKENSLMGL